MFTFILKCLTHYRMSYLHPRSWYCYNSSYCYFSEASTTKEIQKSYKLKRKQGVALLDKLNVSLLKHNF